MSGIFYYSWVILAAILLFIFVLAYFKFVLALPPKTKYLFILSGFIYVLVALGIELVGGWYASKYDTQQIEYIMIVTLEELLEMTGIIIFIYTLLDYLNYYCEPIIIKTNFSKTR